MYGAFVRCFPLLLLFLFMCVIPVRAAHSGAYKVLVVMSYHEQMPWEKEIRDGIQKELKAASEIRYVYLNTKNDPAGGSEKAKVAYREYLEFQPDGVIAADDDAQSLFVVPYLKDKVRTPVIFCGVNAEPEGYGYPASNVTGILERAHFRESISFLQQMLPGAKSIGFLVTDNQTGRGYVRQIRQESPSYPIASFSISKVKTLDDALKACARMKKRHDAMFLIALEGLTDKAGRPLAEKESFLKLTRAFGKPVLGINEFNIHFNMLCAVAKTGQEQGAAAARMLLKAMSGTPLSSMPVTRNIQGRRVLNITVMREMGIKPRPVLLVDTELVESGK